MATIDCTAARELLETHFSLAEAAILKEAEPRVPSKARAACEVVFHSRTQAYREVLLGCTLARMQDKIINIHQPYVAQGENAFSGRTLDERVVNPFLQEKRIPSSRGPYLSAFRRAVEFNAATRAGLRDKDGYDAFLAALSYLESVSADSDLSKFLQYLLYKFAELREASSVPLTRLQRISQEQYDTLISGLLATQSGGLFPVLLTLAMFETIKNHYQLDWTITWQGINVSDKAAQAGGDITIASGEETILALEITERSVDRARVVATFQTKIAPAGLEDYLFLVGKTGVMPEALAQARQYFAQGHEINFVELKNWILMQLVTMGKSGRATFNRQLMALLEEPSVPQALRASWNESIRALLAG